MFSAKVRKEMTGITRHTLLLSVLLAAVIALTLGISASESWAENIEFDDTASDILRGEYHR
jgi:hypothetical protein